MRSINRVYRTLSIPRRRGPLGCVQLSPLMLHATAVAMMEVVDVTAAPIHAQCLAVFEGPAHILNQVTFAGHCCAVGSCPRPEAPLCQVVMCMAWAGECNLGARGGARASEFKTFSRRL